MIDPPGMTNQYLTYNFQVQIWPVHGERLLTPHVWPTSISPKILKFRFILHMVKDDWPLIWLTRIWPKILELRFSLHMVTDDWPPWYAQPVFHLKY